MQEYLDQGIESSLPYNDYLSTKDVLDTGALRFYIEHNCPFIWKMYCSMHSTWSSFAYSYLGEIEGIMKRVDVPHRKYRAAFYHKKEIDKLERSWALVSFNLYKECKDKKDLGSFSGYEWPPHVRERQRNTQSAYAIWWHWYRDIAADNLAKQLQM